MAFRAGKFTNKLIFVLFVIKFVNLYFGSKQFYNLMKFPYTTTLCYIFNGKGEVLLQKKARGFGEGKWNGPGGKVDSGETPEATAIREVEEETEIKIKELEEAGVLEFVFTANQEANNYTYVYRAFKWEGEPKNTGEGKLKWFKKEEIPLAKMWDDDQYWLLTVLGGGSVYKRFYFDANGKVMKYYDININNK